MSKNKIHITQKDVVRAIDWAAAEFNYIEKLRNELEEVERSQSENTKQKKLRKCVKILRYVSKSERRANSFEEEVSKELSTLYDEFKKDAETSSLVGTGKKKFIAYQLTENWFHLDDHLGGDLSDLHNLFEQIKKVNSNLNIYRSYLVKWTSLYEGHLKKELTQAQVLEKIYSEVLSIPKTKGQKKSKKIHEEFKKLIGNLTREIEKIEEAIKALEATLKKAQTLLEKISDESKKHLGEDGYTLLEKYGFDITSNPRYAQILAQSPANLRSLAAEAGYRKNDFFKEELPQTWFLLENNLISWKTLLNTLPIIIQNPTNFKFDKWWKYKQTFKEIINEESWPYIIQIAIKEKEIYLLHRDLFLEVAILYDRKITTPDVLLKYVYGMGEKDPSNAYFYYFNSLSMFRDSLINRLISIEELADELPKMIQALGKNLEEFKRHCVNGPIWPSFIRLLNDRIITFQDVTHNVPLLIKFGGRNALEVVVGLKRHIK
jgi:hypothetical protein